jgi:hypothetical protein
MKTRTALATGILTALLVVGPVAAGPPYAGMTELLGTPTSGETLDVEVSVTSNTPVVPYEYAIQNECSFPGRTGKSYQRDDIVYWTFFEGDNVPHAVVPVYLQSVPARSKCKVFLIRNNTVVKGSTTSYTVD